MAKDIYGDDDGRTADEYVTFRLLSKKNWHPLAPSPEDFDWEDLAFPLGRIPRFNGQLPADGAAGLLETYTVAQHLCLALDLLEQVHPDPPVDLRLAVLLHDAEEALGGLGDPVGPLKHSARFAPILVPYFDAISAAIAAKARMPAAMFKAPMVKECDREAYAIENFYLRNIAPKPGYRLFLVPKAHMDASGTFRCWPIGAAGGIWIARLHELFEKKGISHD